MDKNELFEKIANLNSLRGLRKDCNLIKKWIFELDDQTEKVVIPQFVADWIERCKKEKVILSDSMHGSVISLPDDVYEWFSDSEREKDELFARAWLDGYEVDI